MKTNETGQIKKESKSLAICKNLAKAWEDSLMLENI